MMKLFSLATVAFLLLAGGMLASSCSKDPSGDGPMASVESGAATNAGSNGQTGVSAGDEPPTGVCSAHEVVCGNTVDDCVDLSSSTQHCGSCDRRCFSNQQCSAGNCKGVGVISPSELQQALTEKDFLLINVRVPTSEVIPSTDASIPHDRVDLLKEVLGEDLDRKAVLYCGTATRIQVALQLLQEEGYRGISVLENGITGWRRAGFPTEPVDFE